MAAKASRQRPARVKAALGDPFHLAWPPLDETLGEELVEELRGALVAAGLGRAKGRHRDAAGRKRRAKRGDGASDRRKATDEKMVGEGLKGGDEKMVVGGRAESAMVGNREASVDDDSTEMKEKAVDEERVNRTREEEGKTDNAPAARTDKSVDDANEDAHAKVADETSGDPGLSAGLRRGGWSDASVRREAALGVNEVIRGLERDELSLVLVCGTARPPLLPRLLAALCASRAVPAAQLGALSASVAPLLGLRSVLALGVRRHAPRLAKAAERIGRRLPPLRAPWLSGEAPGVGTAACVDAGVGACRLLPSNVKRLVSNPDRRKRKRS